MCKLEIIKEIEGFTKISCKYCNIELCAIEVEFKEALNLAKKGQDIQIIDNKIFVIIDTWERILTSLNQIKMINEKEFMKMLYRVNKFTIKTQKELDEDLINEINNIRCSYKYLKSELDYKRLYPPHPTDKAKAAYEEIFQFSKNVKCVRSFDINNLKASNGKYMRFYIDNFEITNIIDLSL